MERRGPAEEDGERSPRGEEEIGEGGTSKDQARGEDGDVPAKSATSSCHSTS